MRVLHVLSQRPLRTGSGVTLDAIVRRAASAGIEQRAVVAAPASEPAPDVGGLGAARVYPLLFETDAPGGLPHAICGMSDVMPYPSLRFSSLSAAAVDRYVAAWRGHLEAVAREFTPDVIHSHHVWLVSSIIKDVFGDTPVVTHCHGTGLRQRELCPHLVDRVTAGCARNERFLALHGEQRAQLARALAVDPARIDVVGAGFREDVFGGAGDEPRDPTAVVFAGKLAAAKGVPQLLDAVERVRARRPITLHVAGGGAGDESDALRERMAAMAPTAVAHGMLDQHQLAGLLRRSAVFALPSMYEGLPLVLIEAAACGCRLVATDLPGVREQLAPPLGDALDMVGRPRLVGADRPVAEDVPTFVEALAGALERALDRGPPATPPDVAPFTWDAVFARVTASWGLAS